MWFPATPGWGPVVAVCSPVLLLAPPRLPLGCVALRAPPLVSAPGLPGPWSMCSAVCWGGGGFTLALVLSLVFLLGGGDACTPRQGVTLLYVPSICTRSVQMDLRRSQVLRPFPMPGSGILWVAGESLRDRRVSCLPRWTVYPTRTLSLRANSSTCRGECSWSGPLVTPPRPVPPRAADQRSWAYPTFLRVLSLGPYGHRGGGRNP